MKSTEFTSLFETTEILNVPSADVPTYVDVPLATTRDDTMEDIVAVEFETKIDEEHLEVKNVNFYEDLPDLEVAMFKTTRQAFLRDTNMAGSIVATVDETPVIDAEPQSVTPTYRATEM